MSQFFSSTIKRIRTEKGLSQKALADKMYVTRSTIARRETGARLPGRQKTDAQKKPGILLP